MAASERYQVLVVGSGEAGKYLAWTLSKAGQRTALVERSMVGGFTHPTAAEGLTALLADVGMTQP
jgi:pyruvate/2-oxoglutarate dehydrogenase complex dihydrolipoamide dehydrogenase (E3) component